MNVSDLPETSPDRPSTATCVLAALCSVVFGLLGCVGNLVTIVALSKCRKLHNATTAFVVSLAAADFLFCAVCLPLTATRYIHKEWILGDELCALFPFFFYGNVAASLMSMTAITFNRFILINCYSVYSKIYSRLNVACMIAFCWAFSYVILLPTLTGQWGRFGYNSVSFSCTILKNEDGGSPRKFLFSFGFLLPTITIIICYSCIFYKVRRSAAKLGSHSGQRRPQRREELRVTLTMLACFCTFQVCFLPLMVMNVFEESIRYPALHTLASVLAWMSACTNAFIYVLLNRHYREAYAQLLCSWRVVSASPSCDAASSVTQLRDDRLKASQLSVSNDHAV